MLAAAGTAVEPDLLAPVEAGARWVLAGLGGAEGEAASFRVGRWLFLRALGAVHLAAFVSLWVQVDGLLGSRGILPVRRYLATVRRRSGGPAPLKVPTLFWVSDRDAALHAACGAGVLFSALLFLGVAPAPSLLALWALYLSLTAVGQVFLSYQWDVLLLEASLLGLLVAPWGLFPAPGGGTALAGPSAAAAGPVPPVGLLLLWWLLFRLIFQSGVGKLTSGDPTWRNLDALTYHWWTQPLPTWTAWYVDRLPRWVHRASTLATHVLEIVFPLLLFGPRDVRLVAVAGTVLLQVLILATGNYNFFNLLTIALAILVVDDAAWWTLLPGGLPGSPPGPAADPTAGSSTALTALALAAGAGILAVSGGHLWRTLRPGRVLPGWLRKLLRAVRPFRTVNSYGLFRVMTRRRPEILVQGSRDGRTWETYVFRWKPGDPARRPRFCQPHQPRLDWQMWFAALDSFGRTPWFHAFLARLLEGSEPVRRLLARDPFPERPPSRVRAELYEYRFTTAEERRRSGRWWKRERIGRYAPVLGSGEPG